MESYFFESSLVVGLPMCLFMTSTRSLAREFDNSLDVGLPVCLVHDKHSEPCQKTEFGNSLDVRLPGCFVHDKRSEPCQRGSLITHWT